jgi:hypothetical protein
VHKKDDEKKYINCLTDLVDFDQAATGVEGKIGSSGEGSVLA